MPLKLRPTGLGSGAGKDDPDFVVYSGAWQIGRIYERRGFPENPAPHERPLAGASVIISAEP
jgi:hypothetical protein